MSNLIRRPRYDTLFDDLLKGFFVRPMRWEGLETPQIRLDVVENEKNYVVHAELPGVERDNIHVEIDGDTVAITAEVKNERQTKDGDKVLRDERYYGTVARTFQLGSMIDDTQADAQFKDGVLELTLPKREPAKGHTLQIH